MGFNFDQTFEALKKEVIFLHARWQIYEKIYCTSSERIELINRSASTFFYSLQFILLDDIELSISKLLDPAKQGSNKNLCLETIYLLVEESDLQNNLKLLLNSLQVFSKEIKDRRNKRISHYDLEASVLRSKALFTKASQLQINEILEKIRKFLNAVDLKYYNNTTAYELFSSIGDADSLIQCLKRSESYKFLEDQGKIEHGFFRIHGPFKNA